MEVPTRIIRAECDLPEVHLALRGCPEAKRPQFLPAREEQYNVRQKKVAV